MATAHAPEPIPGGSMGPVMADPAAELNRMASATAQVEASQRAVPPPPNPAFSFPARDDGSASAPASFSRATGRRPRSAIEVYTPSYQVPSDSEERSAGRHALPAFSFNPAATLPPDPDAPMLSPPITPQSPWTMPSGHSGSRPAGHGHRRGGSEFVGGRIREGNSIAVLSGSPTKAESGLASPSLQPPRRGHRRGVSTTLSTTDLSLLPPPKHDFTLKGSSAPNSPTNFEIPAIPPIPKEFIQDTSTLDTKDTAEKTSGVEQESVAVEDEESSHEKPTPRVRVGFSDKLEYIPRPLSLVSTDTSSTITAKPGHGMSGSISSLVTGASLNGRESPATSSRSPSRADSSRPSTAGAVLERTTSIYADGENLSPKRRNSIPALLDLAESEMLASSQASPTKSKRWTFFGLDPFSNHGSPNKARPNSASSGDSAIRVISGASSSDHGSESPAEACDLKGEKLRKKKTKRRKIVKGWADSILPRKSKQSDKSSRYNVRPPTPPASIVPPDEEDDDQMENDHSAQQPAPTLTVTASPSLSQASRRAEDVSSPMIDLDAALGPFNTPLPNNPEWDAAQRAAGNTGRRRLHSAQGMRGFSGPGMHYHRRAESAPDLPPFDRGSSSIHRFGSSSTMADVFEEEDEDEADEEDYETADDQSKSGSKSLSEQDSDGDTTPPAVGPGSARELTPGVRRKSSGLSDQDQSSCASVRAQHSRTSLHEHVIVEEPTNLRVCSSFAFSGSEASGSPRLSPRKVFGHKDLLPAADPAATHGAYLANQPASPYSTSFASTPRSPMSADTQRISTAPSSVHEENSFQSLLLGEPGPEVRLSVDYDIPSLTSSNSTMTRDSAFPPFARMSQPTLREPRPLSVSSAAFGRRRSSLVSLSRLISSSHGERSKLSMEVTLDNDCENKKGKSKTKRLGRLVQFWRPKDMTKS